jgi:hypothetical protein
MEHLEDAEYPSESREIRTGRPTNHWTRAFDVM